MADTQNISTQETQAQGRLVAVTGIVVLLLAALALVGFLFLTPPAEILEGQADATSVRVSGKLPGRVVEFYVNEGDSVHAGDTLVHIHSSLAEAKLMQAEAMQRAAAAQNEKVDAGTRKQIVQSAYELLQQAIAAKNITKKTYDRLEALCSQGVISEQKRDEAFAAYQSAQAAEAAARSQYQMAKEGAQKEDKESAAAMVNVARGGVKEVEAVLEDQYLTAPCDGQIDVIYPNVGELVALGAPIMDVLRLDDKWVVFNIRETYLKDITMGKEIDIEIPALGGLKTTAKVYYIRDMGTYAVWRATKVTGDWDTRTFQVKARPVNPIPDLRPGMTVIYRQPQ